MKTPYLKKFVKKRRGISPKALKKENKNNILIYGSLGIKVLVSCYITKKQIEFIENFIRLKFKRSAKIWNKCVLNKNYSFKPLESRMGKGKGSIENWSFLCKKGDIIFEFSTLDKINLIKNLKSLKYYLPFKFKIIERKI